MGLATLTVDILLTRLLWPVPRVRLETARALSALIKTGDRSAADRLLFWISQRKFESEVILGLNIIEAFDLGAYFSVNEVWNSVNAPSHLSDWLIRENFNQAAGFTPSRYAYAPQVIADLPESVRRNFCEFEGLPRIFETNLAELEWQSGYPFLKRWQHEWEWLQAGEIRSHGDPSYFLRGSSEVTGQFDFANRETYVTAFLRTLSFAACAWGLPQPIAEQFSRTALTLNRGLAGVEPIERPQWSDGILARDRDLKTVASDLWAAAQLSTGSERKIASLRAVEVLDNEYVVFKFDIVTGRTAALASRHEPGEGNWTHLTNPSRYEGSAHDGPYVDDISALKKFCSTTTTSDKGRGSVELLTYVQLPSQYPDFPISEIACNHDCIEMSIDGSSVAIWEHWYSDWQPTCPRAVSNLVGYKTTVKQDFIQDVCERHSLNTGIWCKVKSGMRQYSHLDFQDQVIEFWIDF